MWIEIAHFAALLAITLTVVQIAAPLYGVKSGNLAWIRVGRHAAIVVAVLLTISTVGLINSFLNHDFSVLYVAKHASLDLPIFYLGTAMWGGHEGSLLLWAWLLSVYIAVAAWRHWQTHSTSMPYVLAILGALLMGFLLLVLFLSTPFERLIPPPFDGKDLNPLLQDPGMVFHPPFLYMGYVGFAIPYAFAMAALITGQANEEWLLATRRWTLFSWSMLTTGIVFGAYWAYYELGWGGYWAWDPVENASFMPWLTSTAFLHSVMVQERRKMFKTWNVFLIITTFALAILGTFLVRSGVLSSVHAFASDPGRGVYILVFMMVLLFFSFGVLTMKSDQLETNISLDNPLSKEAAFLFNNLFLLVATLTVLLGTLYPLAVETWTDSKVSVGAPYYNTVFIPIMLGIIFMMGIGPVVAWRKASIAHLKRDLLLPAVLAAIAGVGAGVLGLANFYGICSVVVIVFVLATHILDTMRRVRARMAKNGSSSALVVLLQLLGRNKRRYGGFVVHFGILVMAAGFIGSGLFQDEKNLFMSPSDKIQVGDWNLTLKSVGTASRHNWKAVEAVVQADHKSGFTVELRPQKRVYNETSQPTTEAAIHTTWFEDIYVVLGDEVKDNVYSIRVYRNPLVVWVWAGAGVMAFGVAIALMQGRIRKRESLVG
ncbi:MAG: heme lyase CcmF/NrfE family subunit [Magnetococcales bacterium]|nr:heme lyase CcmF/NrfE family subunit [Magnetococcales bacterium]